MRWKGELALVVVCAAACGAWIGCFDFGSVSNGTPTNDSGTDTSTSGDGGGASEAAAGSFCASVTPTPTFCNDFDESNAQGAWDQIFVDPGCAVTIDTTMPFAGAGSMLAQTPTADAGVALEADGIKQFTAFQDKAIKISVSFEMNVLAFDPSGTGQIIAFEIIFKNSPQTYNQIVMNLNSLGAGAGVTAQIAENATGPDGGASGYNSYPFNAHPPTNTWTKVDVDLVIPSPNAATSNVISVTVDGTPQITQQALGLPLQGGSPYAHLGIGYVHVPAGPWKVEYDNFVVTMSTL